jgi:diaminohydroxyphosphoribosylaminopyrimidine deaminase/5-amino-6-(5-phosphoribosylamino)uracil reductase
MVGAVLVQNDRILGEGFHRYEEKKHAEIWAIEKAGAQTRGSTLYVTLEPCSHQGRTPPCVDEVIRAGVARVVVAVQDPNPLVKGSGFQKLQEAAIELHVGTCAAEATKLIEGYSKFIRTGRPFVVLKAAMTLDGKIAQADGRSQWVTGEAARDYVHCLRLESDAVLTGIGTVLADDPLLTDRSGQPRHRRLIRAVLDTSLQLPPVSRIADSVDQAEVIVFCTTAHDRKRKLKLEAQGIEVVEMPDSEDKVPLPAVLTELGRRQVTSVMIEAGSRLNFEALRAGCVDKLLCFVAPKILGGYAPLPFVGGQGFLDLDKAFPVRFDSVGRVGDDLLVEAYVA